MLLEGCLGLDERYWRQLVGTRGSCMENSQQWGLYKGYWLRGPHCLVNVVCGLMKVGGASWGQGLIEG